MTRACSTRWLLAMLALCAAAPVRSAADPSPAPPQPAGRSDRPGAGVYRTQVTPHWFHDNTRFWYRNDLPGGARGFILVDAEAGTRRPPFDHQKLAAALSKAAGESYQADRLPFDRIEFLQDGKAVRFIVGGTAWTCDLASYACSRSEGGTEPAPAQPPAERPDPDTLARAESPWADDLSPDARPGDARSEEEHPPEGSRRSPDGAWTASIKDHNVVLRDRDGKETPLTRDGTAALGYGMLDWSPDGKAAARSPAEYWAAGVEAYFDAAGDGPAPQAAECPISTREALKVYDPDLDALVDETMAYREHVDWRYKRPVPAE